MLKRAWSAILSAHAGESFAIDPYPRAADSGKNDASAQKQLS
jgi:hypothetical protein